MAGSGPWLLISESGDGSLTEQQDNAGNQTRPHDQAEADSQNEAAWPPNVYNIEVSFAPHTPFLSGADDRPMTAKLASANIRSGSQAD